MGQVIVKYEELKDLCVRSLENVGVPAGHAETVAEVLIHANLRGVNSHGVMRMEHYIKRIESGGININPNITIRDTGPATAVVDGDDGLGHVVADKAMEYAVEVAKKVGVGLVGVINSSHCGAMSYFVSRAARENLIGFATTNTDSFVVPFGGAKPFFGTNPIAYGFPAGEKDPVILDMATSTVAYGKILHAAETNNPIPPDWAVDSQGNPVTDPGKAVALMPFGGPKGYGLGMVVDILSGVLTGSPFGTHVPKMYGDYDKKRKLGHFMGAIDVSRFTEINSFLNGIDQLLDELRAIPPAAGFSRVMAPGDPESNLAKERIKNGIPIVDVEYNFLKLASRKKN